MASWSFIVLSFGLIGLINLNKVQGMSEKERQTLFSSLLPNVLECSGQFEIGADISELIQNPTNLDNLNPCFAACVMKKIKLMNEKGLYDTAKSKKISKKYFSDEDDHKKINELVDTCAEINEKEVSDGEKGCDRAKLLLECFLTHKELFLPSTMLVGGK